MTYSFTKGLGKGVISGLTIFASMLVFAGFSDLTVWGLLEEYLKPALSGMTVGGVITMLLNYIKVRNQV